MSKYSSLANEYRDHSVGTSKSVMTPRKDLVKPLNLSSFHLNKTD